jgi:hypothetical protein
LGSRLKGLLLLYVELMALAASDVLRLIPATVRLKEDAGAGCIQSLIPITAHLTLCRFPAAPAALQILQLGIIASSHSLCNIAHSSDKCMHTAHASIFLTEWQIKKPC